MIADARRDTMCVMVRPPTHISIRELQRNAAAVLSGVERGQSYLVTRRGRTVGRLLPPDAADHAIGAAVDRGTLDPAVHTQARTARQSAAIRPAGAPGPGGRSISDALDELRADER